MRPVVCKLLQKCGISQCCWNVALLHFHVMSDCLLLDRFFQSVDEIE